MMEVDRALRQLSDIHDQISRTSYYLGYRAIPVACSGGIAVVAAVLQPHFLKENPGYDYARYWAVVAAIAFLAAVSGSVMHFRSAGRFDRGKTLRAFGQFFPALFAGALVTAIGWKVGNFPVEFLPGLWALCFSLGIFSTGSYLPSAIRWAALYYFAAGALLLLLGGSGASLSPWGMAIAFGGGQFLCAAILYGCLERKIHGNPQ